MINDQPFGSVWQIHHGRKWLCISKKNWIYFHPEKEILVSILTRICSKAVYVHIGTAKWNMWVHLGEYPKFVVLCTCYICGKYLGNKLLQGTFTHQIPTFSLWTDLDRGFHGYLQNLMSKPNPAVPWTQVLAYQTEMANRMPSSPRKEEEPQLCLLRCQDWKGKGFP